MPKSQPHSPEIRQDGLQLDEPRRLQEWFWSAQRIAWAVFALLIVLALLGFTGAGGAFSQGRAQLGGGGVEHPRFTRWQVDDEFVFTLPAGGPEQSLTVDAAFADAFEVISVQPQPSSYEALPEGYRTTFALQPGAASRITVFVRPRRLGVVTYGVSVDDGAPTLVTSYVLP